MKARIGLKTWNLVMLGMTMILGNAGLQGQSASVLRSVGDAAVINGGSSQGFAKNDRLEVSRREGADWRKIATARITIVQSDISRIEAVERIGNATILPGDRVRKVVEEDIQSLSREEESDAAAGRPAVTRSGPTRSNVPSGPSLAQNRGGYIGPVAGVFIPLSRMKDDYGFESNFAYGGAFGFRMRSDLDLAVRFLFSAKPEWTLWTLNMHGRWYLGPSGLLDVGYGILYPKGQGGASGDILLGLLAGTGFTFPISQSGSFEMGLHYHFYPQFGEGSGQFLTVHAGLMF